MRLRDLGFGASILACSIVAMPCSWSLADETQLPDSIEQITGKLKVHDFDSAIQLIENLEEQTHPKACLFKAFQYEFGIGREIDQDKAIAQARLAAAMEDWEAAQFLSWKAISGSGEDVDLKLAMDWRGKLIKWKESNPSPRVLPETLLIPDKNSYQPNYTVPANWNYEKAKSKDPVAQFNMFIILFDGKGMESDALRAMAWLMRSANAGNGPAARWLSFCYKVGLLTKENDEMALKYLKIAAEGGDAQAQYDLAMKYFSGRDVDEDTKEGLKWLDKAADQDYVDAIAELAELYYEGELVGKDRVLAFALYTKAHKLGHEDSLYDLAWMTFYGQGVKEDAAKGMQLFEEASELGSIGAANRLAKIYLFGWEVEQDPVLAKRWADKAIELGSEYAYYVHGIIHQQGLLGEVDLEEAFYQFELAAREGHNDSQVELGLMLVHAQGIERDLEEAYTWFTLAADDGDDNGLRWKYLMEGLGWGTEKNSANLIKYAEMERGKPMTEGQRKSLLKTLIFEPEEEFVLEEGVEFMELLEGSDYEGRALEDLTEEEWDDVREIVDHSIDKLREEQAPDPAELAKAAKENEAQWEKAFKTAKADARKASGLVPPKLWKEEKPPFPAILRILEMGDTVVVVMTIGKDGLVKEHVFESETFPELKKAVSYILPKWRFIPGFQDGKPVNMRVRMPIPFVFHSELPEDQNE